MFFFSGVGGWELQKQKTALRIMGSQNWWFGDPSCTHPNPSKIGGLPVILRDTDGKKSAFFPLVTESLAGGSHMQGIFPIRCEVGSLPMELGPQYWDPHSQISLS